MKVCSKCHQQKVEDSFRKASNKQCIACIEKVRRAQRKNPEGERARRKLYRERHPERVKAQVKRWRTSHPEVVAAQKQRYQDKHPEVVAALNKRYRENHPEAETARHKRWRKAHPEAGRSERERERRRQRERVRSKRRREEIYARDGGRCGICGTRVPFNRMTLDHIVPRSKGGKNTPENLRLAHMMCNSARRDVGPAQTRLALV